ncbi:amino acid adenylation domain-containing protein [Gordonia sp. DT30]|uniref:amino acid adenylation domain-containing protein n=1 Tax=Gordonia sp. DT30 TaxID=3416546 RepID=UPI003CEB6329
MADDAITGHTPTGTRRFRLDAAQRALWTTAETLPQLPLNIAQYVELRGPIDIEAFLRHTTEAVRRGQFMQVRYEQTPDGPVGVYDPSLHANPEYLDLRGESDPRAAADAFMRADHSRPVDPATDRVMFGWLLHLGDDHYYFYNRAHHLVVDGISGKDAIRALLDAYTAGIAGEPIPHPGPVDFDAPARADADYRASTRYATDRAYWRETLADMPSPASLSHRTGPPAPLSRVVSADIPSATMAALERAATAHHSTVPAVIATALAAYLCRATGRDDPILNLPVAARTTAALRRTPLPVSNVVPLRTGVRAAASVADALRDTGAALMGALRHQRYRYEDIRADLSDDLGNDAAGSRNPLGHRGLPGPMLNLMLFDREFRCGDATATFHVLSTSPVDDLAVNVYPAAGASGLVVDIEANPNRYDAAEVAQHHRQLLAMLAVVALAVDVPGVLIDDLPLYNDDPVPRGGPGVPARTLPEILASAVVGHPEAVALDVPGTGETLTYRQLDAHAVALAGRLFAAGARTGRTVAIEIPRGRDQLVAWWAVAYTGATILLLDPAQPPARRARILETAAPIMVLTALDDLPAVRAPRPHPATRLDDAAYLVFTSGTTGDPKPITVGHRGLATVIAAQRPLFGDDATAPPRIAALASATFDAAHFEILAAAATGATLVPCRSDTPLGPQLTAGGVTHVVATPSVLATIPDASLPRVVVSVGEALPTALAVALSADHRVVNLYGPAEFTIWSTEFGVDGEPGADASVPIGTPIAGAEACVLDHRLRPVPPGVIGELYLAGPQVALGYPGRTALTAERFVACPWQPGQRMYRTGDLVRIHPGTGALHFHGRADDQLSVHGVRIEPGEIEHAAAGFDGVTAAAVVPGEHWLDLAVVVAADADRASLPGDLRRHFAAALPPVMWPRHIAVVAGLPVSAGGKLDRAAVAALIEGAAPDVAADVAPQGAGEQAVADAVAEVLGIERPSMAADLISLGGSSLQAVAVRDRLGAAGVGVGEILGARDLRAVARLVADASSVPDVVGAEPLRGRAPAGAAQRAMVLAQKLMPHSTVDAVRFTVRLPGVGKPLARTVIGDLIARHEILRTVLFEERGEVWAEILAVGDALDEVLVDGAVEVPSLIGSIPLRVAITEDDGASVVTVAAHHVLVDDRSLEILGTDALFAVAARASGRAPDWDSVPTGYLVAARAEAARVGDPGDPDSPAAAHLRFWTATLADLPARDRLPVDRPRRDRVVGPAAAVVSETEIPDAEPLLRRAAAARVTTVEWLHAAVVLTLRALTDADDTVVVIPALGRSAESADVVGMFVNPIAVRVRVPADATIGAVVEASATAIRRGADHAALPFGEVVRVADTSRDLFGWPLSDVVFTHRDSFDAGGLAIEVAPPEQALVPVKLDTELTGGSLRVRLTYRTDWFSHERARELLDVLTSVLRAMTASDGLDVEPPVLGRLSSVRDSSPAASPVPLPAADASSTQVVLDVVGGVLGTAVAVDDRLLDRGVTSLSVMQIAAELGERTGAALEVRDVAAAETVGDLCALVDRAVPVEPAPDDAPALTPQQAEIWVLQRMQPDATVYHLPVQLTLAEGIGAAVVRAALVDVALRHPALRTLIDPGDGRPIPRVLGVNEAAGLLRISVGPFDDSAASEPFDLAHELPWRAIIDDASPVELLITAHHVLVDAWSMRILVDEFAAALEARATGAARAFASAEPPRPRPPAGDDVTRAERYWAQRLGGAAEHLALPEPAHPASGATAGDARYVERAIPADVLAAASRLAADAGTTVHSVLRVALDATLAAYPGSDDIVTAAPIAGRDTTTDLRAVGMLVQTVLLRSTGVRDQQVGAALVAAATELADARTHAHLGYRGIADAAGAHTTSGVPAFLDVILAYGADAPDFRDTGLVTAARPIRVGTARTALEFTVDTVDADGAPALRVTATIAPRRVDAESAERLLDTFVATVTNLASATPDCVVGECLPGVDAPASLARRTSPRDPIAALARHCVERPTAVAVVDSDGEITYQALAQQVRELANRLAEAGVRPGDRVALRMGRSSGTVVAMLAVLHLDAAYVPIDPAYPAARIETILADTGPVAVIDGDIDDGDITVRERGEGVPWPGAAYVIHTSGTTGKPKGVQVTRQNLAAMLGAALDAVDARPGAVWSWTHSYAFDFSVWEIFGALASGGTVVVVDRATVLDPQALVATLSAHRVEILSQTPTSFARIVDPALVGESGELSSLRCVVFGGEALDAPSLAGWAAAHPGVDLVNMYGITETTVHLTHTRVDVDDGRSLIGAPLDGVTLRVLDDRLRPVPVGGRGELYVAGAQVSDGYLGESALTANRFVADPAGTGVRLYRTGDLVRVLAESADTSGVRLAYLGRRDDQVQIRGHRIDLGEIAAVLRTQPGVTDARVVVDAGALRGDERIVGFVLADSSVAETDLLSGCAAVLPGYAVPARIGVVAQWPMIDTGKLDHTALLALLTAAPEAERPLTAAETPIAEAVADVVGAALSALRPSSNFFMVGGNSLSAARLAARLTADGRPVGVADVFAHPTIDALARFAGSASTQPRLPDLPAAPLSAPLPPTPEQEELWLRWRAAPEFTGHLLPFALPVDASRPRLVTALAALLDRHDALRTSFPADANGPIRQQLWTASDARARLQKMLDGPPVAESVDAALAALRTPLDLTVELPWRLAVLDDPDDDGRVRLVGVIHHIAVDGESLDVLAADLHALLAGADLDPVPVGYRDYTVWRAETLEARRDELRAYWRSVFTEPVEPLFVPGMDLTAHADVAAPAVRVVHRFDPPVTRTLQSLAVEHHSTLYAAVHTAVAAVLARASRSRTITIGAATSGRIDGRWAPVVGPFARTVPMHVDVDTELPFPALLSRITAADLGAFAHADLPLAEITEIADPGRISAGRPLVDVALGALDGPVGPGYLNSANPVALHGLDVVMVNADDSLHLAMTCTAAVAEEKRLATLLASVVGVLESAVGGEEGAVAVQAGPVGGVESAARTGAVAGLAELLGAGVRLAPDAIAVHDLANVVSGLGHSLTFAELDRVSTRLARRLIGEGIGPGDVVALELPRSAWSVIALHAIAKTGAAFVNVDPADPPHRRDERIAEADARTVLEIDDVAAAVAVAGDPAPFDAAPFDPASFDPAERIRPLHADDVAYLTFTSGTTGTPKGVAVTHRGLGGLARDAAGRMALRPGDITLHTYDLGFDAHLMGLLPVHHSGATLTVCPPTIVGGDDLARLLTEHRVEVLLTTPSVLSTLPAGDHPDLRHVVVGGEALTPALVRRWAPHVTLTNEYGPTEATVAASAVEVTADAPVGIGTGIADTRLHILDDRLRPVPDWTLGELYLTGPALARGYHRESALTAAAFVAAPSSDGGRMYRTGDLVYRTADGAVIFVGRGDDQLKVRGIRVEPGEIDAALETFDEVRTAVSDVRMSAVGEKILVAWVVLTPGAELDVPRLRAGIGDILPRSIIPAAIGRIDALPFSRNGKLDLSRLPTPLPGAHAGQTPSTPTERVVAAVFSELLGLPVDHITTGSDFFALGGTSLSATRAQSRLSAQENREVPLALLFSGRTVGEVARGIDALDAGRSIPAPRRRPRPDRLPLSYAQRRLWIQHRLDPDSTAYHVPLVLRLDPGVDVTRLRAAVDAVVAAHESLRTLFPDTADGPEQFLVAGPVVVERVVPAGRLGVVVSELLCAPFDLTREVPLRVELLSVAGGPIRYLVATMHHVAVDGWSMRILVDDLLRAYHGAALPAEGLDYGDYTRWQHELLGDPADPESRYTRDIEYWREVLADVGAPIRLPGNGSGPEGQGGRITAHVSAAVAADVARVASESAASVLHAAHLALALVLGGWTGRTDLVIGTPVHGRSAPEWESVVGMFVNTLALRTRLEPTGSIGAALKHVRDVAVTGAAHAEVPYDAVVRAIRPDAHGFGDPLISVLLVNQDVLPDIRGDGARGDGVRGGENVDGAGITVDTELMDATGSAAIDAKFDIEVVLAGTGPHGSLDGGFDLTVVHSVRVDSASAAAMLDDLLVTFAGLAAPGSSPLPKPPARELAVDQSSGIVTPPVVVAPPGWAGQALTPVVGEVMARVLGIDASAISTDDEFFALGGTSLSATQVTALLAERIGRPVETRLLFDHPTPAALAAVLAAGEWAGVDEWVNESAVPAGEFELAPTQRRMWVNHQLSDAAGAGMYTVPVGVPVPAGTSRARVIGAVAQLVERHPALRTGYRDGADGPRQTVLPHWLPPVTEVAATDLTAEVMREIVGAPFDLAADEPPVRVTLILGDADPVGLTLVAHHISLDGESAGILHRELTTLLDGGDLGPPPAPYAAVARWLTNVEGAQRQRQLDFWSAELDGYSGRLDLAAQRPVVRDLSTYTLMRPLGDEASVRVREVAAAHRCSAFHVLHTALVLALGVQAGADDVAVATPASLRWHPGMRGTVGMLVSTVVLRVRLGPGETVSALIRRVRDADLAALDNAIVGFDDLVALTDVPREAGRHPLVQVSFSMIDAALAAVTSGIVGPEQTPSPHSEFDLQVLAVDDGGRYRLGFVYARDLFAEHEIEAIADRVEEAVHAVVDGPQRRVSTVPLLLSGERAYLDDAATFSSPEQPPLLADFWTRTVQRYPELLAVDDGARALTYRAADDWISVTARALRARGLGAGDAVAVAIPRSVESMIAFWAVTRIGATCVPIDVGYPEGRIKRVIAAAGATRIGLADIPARPDAAVEPEAVTRVSADALAYVITTSGTTGVPNAVGVSHRGLWRLAHSADTPGTVLDRVAGLSSPGFDATIFDLLAPVLTGGTHVVVPAELTGGSDLTAWLARLATTTFFATPAVLATLDPRALTSLRAVFVGGEAVPRDLLDQWTGAATVTSVYGPTETTVFATGGPHRRGDQVGIGHPLPGTGALVLDSMLRPCPPGMPGELYLAGDGLARGYLGNAGLTASRFVAGPDGRRLYRTGDLVRWDPRGTGLHYLSRIDRQVKIRGQRVEPAEVDAVLRSAGAGQAATLLVSGPAGDVLVSYVVGDVDVARLRAACATMLPRHAVPSQIVVVDELPLTGAGKLDAARLPEPTWTQSRRAPVTPTETAVVEAFSSVLGEAVGMDDDFFAAGGTSLALLRLRDEIVDRTGLGVSAAGLFAASTPAGVVDLLTRPTDDAVLELSDAAEGPIVWCVHPASGLAADYRPLAEVWPGHRVLGLQLPGLEDAAAQDMSFERLVDAHVATIRRRQPVGPYRLVGWSLGGVLAQEIARRLGGDGGVDDVELLALLDSYVPAHMPADAGELDASVVGHVDPELLAAYEQRVEALVASVRAHRPAPVRVGKAVYVAAAGSDGYRAWEPLLGEIRVVTVPAAHHEFGKPEVMEAIGELLTPEL